MGQQVQVRHVGYRLLRGDSPKPSVPPELAVNCGCGCLPCLLTIARILTPPHPLASNSTTAGQQRQQQVLPNRQQGSGWQQ